MNDSKDIRAYERGPASEEVKQNRTETINIGGRGKLSCSALSLFGGDVARCSKCLQRSGEVAILIEPFCQTKVAHHGLAIFITENVSRLKIAMQNSFAVRVSNRPRNFRHQSHTLAR